MLIYLHRDQYFYAMDTDDIRDCIKQNLLQSKFSLEDAVDSLETTPRSLQRALLRDGTSFSQIRDEEAIAIACNKLLQGELIENIASSLGYKSESAFSRAFRRMKGRSPSEWREMHS